MAEAAGGDQLVAIQMPATTAAKPTIRLGPIPSPMAIAPTTDANTGLTVMVTAVLVGLVRESAKTQRMKAPALPTTPRYATASHCEGSKRPAAKKPQIARGHN